MQLSLLVLLVAVAVPAVWAQFGAGSVYRTGRGNGAGYGAGYGGCGGPKPCGFHETARVASHHSSSHHSSSHHSSHKSSSGSHHASHHSHDSGSHRRRFSSGSHHGSHDVSARGVNRRVIETRRWFVDKSNKNHRSNSHHSSKSRSSGSHDRSGVRIERVTFGTGVPSGCTRCERRAVQQGAYGAQYGRRRGGW